MSRTKRALLWIGGGLLGLVPILFVTGIAIARTDWFRSMVREKIVSGDRDGGPGRTRLVQFRLDPSPR